MPYNKDLDLHQRAWHFTISYQDPNSNFSFYLGVYGSVGQNIAVSSGGQERPWVDVIQDWYDEIKDFRYGLGPTAQTGDIGHFTQVVEYNSVKNLHAIRKYYG